MPVTQSTMTTMLAPIAINKFMPGKYAGLPNDQLKVDEITRVPLLKFTCFSLKGTEKALRSYHVANPSHSCIQNLCQKQAKDYPILLSSAYLCC